MARGKLLKNAACVPLRSMLGRKRLQFEKKKEGLAYTLGPDFMQ